jgi:hypothetical protein
MMYRLFTYILTDDTTVDVTVKCSSYVDGARKARAKADKVAHKRGEWCERLLSTSAVTTERAIKIRGEDERDHDHDSDEDGFRCLAGFRVA